MIGSTVKAYLKATALPTVELHPSCQKSYVFLLVVNNRVECEFSYIKGYLGLPACSPILCFLVNKTSSCNCLPVLFPAQNESETLMENSVLFMESKNIACVSFSSGEARMTDKPGTSFSREAVSPEEIKLTGDVSGATASIDIKPKSIQRAKTWSGEVENLYRFQQAGYRDETEYKQVKHVDVDRVVNFSIGIVASLLLIVTLISAFVFPHLPPKPVNIFFAFCISLSCFSAGILIYWYRQGDLEPKFRNLIYYVLFSIVMLCICANLYFHEVGK